MPEAPRALVTGATGFVGSRLARRLAADGWAVHAVVRPASALDQLDPVRGNVEVHAHDGTVDGMTRIVAAARPDVVFHLASYFVAEHKPEDVRPLVESNVAFGSVLLEAMGAMRPPLLVNAGTAWQHGGTDGTQAVCLYAATKQAFEAVVDFHAAARGLCAATLLLYDTYGPGDPRAKLFAALTRATGAGTTLAMSPGEQRLDLVHIDDAVDAFVRAAGHLRAGTVTGHARYAVSSGQAIPLKEVVARWSAATGQAVNVDWGARPYRAREVMVPWTGGAPVPGWAPRIPLDEGLAGLAPGAA